MENSHKVSTQAVINTDTEKDFLLAVFKIQIRGKAIEDN